MEHFEDEIAELLEVDSVSGTDELNSFDSWDSLTILSIIAYADDTHKVTLSAKELNDAGTIGGLKTLIQNKKQA